ncbi:hypothetical protein B5C34_09130 [Pacificimonas flava]|uniref:Beta-lactamase-related domain-containing protein n=2 Tax=Pacificimonas TaxID=1960290 RepID=A0A219B751_9SPHN|nr:MULTISPECIES: serine hydrolase domain-containing protein [Pacificimonas]MBZ6379167.1 beta-lactamase family protein [Pacificimonas aurantium]OWV33608.1 hypothetical protein B5C34_09130 [Pacificimonas flava]
MTAPLRGLCALVATCLAAAPAFAAEEADWLDEHVPALLERFDVPSAGIALIEDGEISLVRHYGEQEWGVPANEETLYNVASLSKPVSAETVLRLIAAGDAALDMPLAESYVDADVADDPRIAALTPELVMRHRTGFPNWRYETEGTLRFLRDPDTETGYSGEGYEWMAKAVAAHSGRDFEQAARELVFGPANMPLSSFTKTGKFFGRIAYPYKAGESVYNVVRTEMSASDDLRTTAREYARFMIDVWEGDRVPAALRREQTAIEHYRSEKSACPEAEAERADFCPAQQGWGLGWFVYDYGDRTIVEHSGGDVGERTLAFYDLTNKRGVVVLTNGANGTEILTRVAGRLYGDDRFAAFLMAPFG